MEICTVSDSIICHFFVLWTIFVLRFYGKNQMNCINQTVKIKKNNERIMDSSPQITCETLGYLSSSGLQNPPLEFEGITLTSKFPPSSKIQSCCDVLKLFLVWFFLSVEMVLFFARKGDRNQTFAPECLQPMPISWLNEWVPPAELLVKKGIANL